MRQFTPRFKKVHGKKWVETPVHLGLTRLESRIDQKPEEVKET